MLGSDSHTRVGIAVAVIPDGCHVAQQGLAQGGDVAETDRINGDVIADAVLVRGWRFRATTVKAARSVMSRA